MEDIKVKENKKYDMSIFDNMEIELPEEIKRETLKLLNEKGSGYFVKDKFKEVRIEE